MALRILLTGGGSGGHAYPLVAVAEELQNQARAMGTELELRFAGSDGLLKGIAESISVGFDGVMSGKWRRYSSIQNLIDILKLPVGFCQALFYVWKFMPDMIFSKGGYDSFLPSLAAKIFMIPIIIHESDSVPGKANVWVGKWARKVYLAFDGARSYFKSGLAEAVGNPIRSGILANYDKSSAAGSFGLDPNKPIILITGASQGARILNDVLLLAVVELTKKFQIIHQTGDKNFASVNEAILNIIREGQGSHGAIVSQNYRLYPSLDLPQMALAYGAADVVVSRAGAGSIFEIAAIGKPAIIVPLRGSAGEHQSENAREFAKFGAIILEEQNLTPHILINEIGQAYVNRLELSNKIKAFAKPAAARIIATRLLAMA